MVESLFVIALGLIIGSFLNVVIYRLPRDLSVVRPGSRCPGCGKPVAWYQNLPLVSYLFLRGKCGSCAAPISIQYPIVEFITAVLFFASWRGLGFDAMAIVSQIRLWVFISLCVAITFIDLEHRIIPDELSLGGWAFGLITAYWDFRQGMVPLMVASVAGFGFFFLFALLYEKLTGRMGLGGGDIKFMGTIGIFLGLGGLWTSLVVSSIVGSVVGLSMGWWQKRRDAALGKESSDRILKTAIPYGPFLVFGALVELFFEVSKWLNL